MEKIPHNIEGERKTKINKIIEKAKRFLKIGSIASIGLFLQGCTEQEKDALADSIQKSISVEDKNISHDAISEDNSEQISLPKDSKYRNISYEEFLKSGLYTGSDNSQHAEIILTAIELEKEIGEIQSRAGNYGKLSEGERERMLAHKIENLENLRGLQEEYSPENVYKKLKSDIQNSYAIGDEQRVWLSDVVKSKEYKERLFGEFDDAETSELNHQVRKKKIADKDYDVHPRDTFEGDTEGAVMAHWLPREDKVEITKRTTGISKTTPLHEFAHDMTMGNTLLSKKALMMYTESFDQNRMFKYELEDIEYFKDPTERDARKKQLEFELEELGVKKYGEEFTDAHYGKMIELQRLGKFSIGADKFIRMTKPEYFKRIMNEIAEQKIVSDDEQNNNA